MADALIVYAITQPDETTPSADALRVHGWFLPGPDQDTAAWWRSHADSPDFVGYWKDKLAQAAARHPESRAITLAGRDGLTFMGFVRDV